MQDRGTPDLQPHLPVIDPQLPQEQAGLRPGRSTLDQVAKPTSDIEVTLDENLKGRWCCICWSHCSLWPCMVARPHAEAASDATEPTHGALHFWAHLKSQRCRENQRWSTKQSETLQQWCPTRICSVAPAYQRLHSRIITNQLEEVGICRRPCFAQSSPRLEHDWRDIKPGCVHSVNLAKQWRLKWSEAKTVSATFHLNNRSAKRELNVNISGKRLTCQRTPIPTLE